MSADPTQSEVDAVYCAIYHAWDGHDLEKAARAAIAELDRVRAEQHKDDCPMCKQGVRLSYGGGPTEKVTCVYCNCTGKRTPDATGG